MFAKEMIHTLLKFRYKVLPVVQVQVARESEIKVGVVLQKRVEGVVTMVEAIQGQVVFSKKRQNLLSLVQKFGFHTKAFFNRQFRTQ
jgi:hypothetical protein